MKSKLKTIRVICFLGTISIIAQMYIIKPKLALLRRGGEIDARQYTPPMDCPMPPFFNSTLCYNVSRTEGCKTTADCSDGRMCCPEDCNTLQCKLPNKRIHSKYTNFSKIQENCGLNGEYFLGTWKKSLDCMKWLATYDDDYYHVDFNTPLLFHSFMHEIDENNLHPVMYAYILSFLITQRKNSELWIWTQNMNTSKARKSKNGLQDITFVLPKSSRIKIKLFDDQNFFLHIEHIEAVKDLFHKNKAADESFLNMVKLSDFVRFAVLDIYGGLYVDVDTILLRSLQPLIHHQFAYRFGVNSKQSNNAIIHFKKGGLMVRTMLRAAYNPHSNQYNLRFVGPGSFERHLRNYLLTRKTALDSTETQHFIIYPVAYFDPQWIRFDRGYVGKHLLFEDGLSPPQFGRSFAHVMLSKYSCTFPEIDIFANFFHGAFAYHCHCYKPHKHLLMETGSCMHHLIKAMRKNLSLIDN